MFTHHPGEYALNGIPLTLCGRRGPDHVIATDGTTSCEECALIRALKDPKNAWLIAETEEERRALAPPEVLNA